MPAPHLPRTARPISLTIAGSDSGGGAGIQADLKTFHQFGVYGTSVITAVTAQNTQAVTAVQPIEASVIAAQIDAVASDLRPHSVKTGMLATSEVIATVRERIQHWKLGPVIVDPVMIATSGDPLIEEEAARDMVDLLSVAALVTPNIPEARVLTGLELRTPDDLAAAARQLVRMGAGAALVKGGHLPTGPNDTITDVLWDGADERRWSRPRVESRHTHGTGCTLSAAAAAGLAHGRPVGEAVAAALTFVTGAIRRAPGLGSGNGPVDHFTPPPGWATDLR